MNARRFLPLLAVACLLAITSRAAGQDVWLERESLAGLAGLFVTVNELGDNAQEGGLTEGALLTYVEMRLRQAGITVMSEGETKEERTALLTVTPTVLPLGTGRWAYSLLLYVAQIACIDRMKGPPCRMARTWQKGGLYATGGRLPTSVRGNLAALMDQLVNDYLAVNP